MKVFVGVADATSFVRAAEALQLPTATVTRMIQALEAHLKVKLLNRSSRKVALTDEGSAYYARCVNVLAEIDDMEANAACATKLPEGRVKISLPAVVAKAVLIPALPDFLTRFPGVSVELAISDRQINLIEDLVDCAIRVGAIDDDPGIVAKRIGSVTNITCAAPRYLQRYGEPGTIADLEQHVGVGYIWSNGGGSRPWEFTVDEQAQSVHMRHTVFVNDADAYLACAKAGLGIIRAADYTVRDALRCGELQQILPSYQATPRDVSILFHQNRHMPRRLRAFIDWFAEVYQNQSGDV
ncbi:MAG: LysR family transcriptional regulator [Massilia sp.]